MAAVHNYFVPIAGSGRTVCTLRDLPEGARARVHEVTGCCRTRSRLCALGFTPGTEVFVCGKGDGRCRVEVRDTCVVLDGDCAGTILCSQSGTPGE